VVVLFWLVLLFVAAPVLLVPAAVVNTVLAGEASVAGTEQRMGMATDSATTAAAAAAVLVNVGSMQ
jgi:hypothetical protein